ncbi:hypothetical protein F8388_021778 [Cannabis sativa]|uniref:TF-B3 domain-containing protein n=1 Tax=Cannabis sativa TaxID=3483 RepID=A0A7J6DTU6_CANSA|nr:hypothetical protein G4B88_000540 [Cannabis sativa]KAF4349210.1 hypothetical protein F8388_021778 [Cannabis sativa]
MGRFSKLKRVEVVDDNDDEDCHEFFKVFMPTFSTKNMWIPPKFAQKFMKRIPKEVKVKDENGKNWSFGMKKKEEKVYIVNGKCQWEEFVKEHKLKRGDFLVFKYYTSIANSNFFHVKIYACNGCNKKQLHHKTTITQPGSFCEHDEDIKPTDEELEKVGENSSNEREYGYVKTNTTTPPSNSISSNLHFLTIINDNTRKKVKIPSGVVSKVKLEEKIILHCKNNELFGVGITYDKDGQAFISSKWSHFLKRKNLNNNDKKY